ncbi:MAG: NYN domain-containing protein, partial [Planctomycetales bacterium]|nr:NYN domain-containing protein [Planctomycetales bacterium]
LPRTTTLEGITVHYAADYDDADELIEELIRRDSAPRQLTVVSSDHRLQRAARRRRATAIDSDVWFGQLLQQRRERAGEPVDFAKPLGEVSQHEVLYWLKEFGLEADGEIARSADTSTLSNNPDIPDGDTAAADETREPPEHEKPPAGDHWDNIFPPGYGDDLLDETD